MYIRWYHAYMKRILLLSPYDAASHRYWRQGLIEHLSGHRFEQITLPARYFSWRFRGNSLTLAHDASLEAACDLILATSMTDLAGLKGMRPSLASVPSILYFHENQFAWPADDERNDLDRQLTSLYSALSADRLVFNSGFNRRTFLDGVASLLSRMPDHVPAGIVEALSDKALVMPVPLYGAGPGPFGKASRFSIVWNHRWEFDKGVEELREVVHSLIETGMDFTFHLLGQQFRRVPDEMKACVELLRDAGRLGRCGFIENRDDYLGVLAQSHVVLSTARHEFQGLAVLEAVDRGCLPAVPDGLAYPEFFDADFRYGDPRAAVDMIVLRYQQSKRGELPAAPDVGDLSWRRRKPAWCALIDALI